MLKVLLYPFALIYGSVIRIRNLLYNRKILKTASFKSPVILVGNLSTGGTGKTPCVEYLIRMLNPLYKVAVLSRGYKRKTNGFIIGNHKTSSSREIGDEPLQMLSKFPQVIVAVDKKRKRGIQNLFNLDSPPDCVILDDGYQHRRVKPGLQILLTEYNNIFSNDHLLPVGNLREHSANSSRANIIVITKSPHVHSPISEKILISQLKPSKNQLVFFSYINFGEFLPVNHNLPKISKCKKPNTILLFTGIANPSSLEQYLQDQCSNLITISFPDHHVFSGKDIAKIIKRYNDLFTKNKIIVTTEKDFYRLKHEKPFNALNELPVYYIPICMEFHPHPKSFDFDQAILNYVRKNTKNSVNGAIASEMQP